MPERRSGEDNDIPKSKVTLGQYDVHITVTLARTSETRVIGEHRKIGLEEDILDL